MSDANGGGTVQGVVRPVSGVLLAVGLMVSVALLATNWQVILLFVLAGVFPSLLGYAGLAWTGALPWQGTGDDGEDAEDVDLVEDLKQQYARGELDDAELERKVEALLAAEDDGMDASRGRGREREPEFGRR